MHEPPSPWDARSLALAAPIPDDGTGRAGARRSSLMTPTLDERFRSPVERGDPDVVGSGSAPQLDRDHRTPGRSTTRAVDARPPVSRTSRARLRPRASRGRRRRRSPWPRAPRSRPPAREAHRSSDRDRDRAGSGRPRAARPPRAARSTGIRPSWIAVRQHEHVGREAVPAEVRGLPEACPARACGCERVVERRAEAGATGIAAAVGADEDDRPGDAARRRSRSARASSSSAAELLPRRARRPLSSDRRPGSRSHRGADPAAGRGCTLPENALERLANRRRRARCRRRRPGPRRLAPRRAASSLASVAVPASGSPAASDDGGAGRGVAHAGQPVGEQPAERRVDPELGREGPVLGERLRACRGPGGATARRRTFFGVCSSSTNSTTWTS